MFPQYRAAGARLYNYRLITCRLKRHRSIGPMLGEDNEPHLHPADCDAHSNLVGTVARETYRNYLCMN